MQGDMEIFFDDPADLGSLRTLLADHERFTVAPRAAAARAGELSAGRAFLEIVFGGGGSAAAFGLIKTWLESKVTVIKIRVSEDGEEIIVRSLHAAQDLERAKAALRAKRGDDADS